MLNDHSENNVDGDKVSFIVLHSEESCKEVTDMLHKRNLYIGTDGSVLFSASNTVIDVVTKTLSWEPTANDDISKHTTIMNNF